MELRLVLAIVNLRCEYAVSVVRCQWSVAFSGPWRIYRVFLAAPLRDHRAGLPPGLRPVAPPGGDESVNDVGAWIVAKIDAEVRPGFEMVWNKRVKREMA